MIQVSWLEVTGKTKLGDNPAAGKYEVGFKVSFKKDAFGWSSCQAFLMTKFGKKGKYVWKKVSLGKEDNKGPYDEKINIEVKQSDLDKQSDPEKQIYFGLYEVWSGKWKGGLEIHGAFIKKI